MKWNGVVKSFSNRGFGFIICESIERDLFFHLSDWRSIETPLPGQRVAFEVIPARIAGKPNQATNVHPQGPGSGTPIATGLAALAKGLGECDERA
jgi:cold shock CspA family protein